MPIGIAYPPSGVGQAQKGTGKTFRLVVGKVELLGKWICVGAGICAAGGGGRGAVKLIINVIMT